MARYMVRRLGEMIPILLALSFVIFALLELVPGDPLDLLLMDPSVSVDDVARLRALYGLDQPTPVRYAKWLRRVVKGDLGYSRTYNRSVRELIPRRLSNTLTLTITAFSWSLLLAIGLGSYSALHQYSWVDYLGTFLSFIGLAMPVFWLALILMLIFSVKLGWLPAGGMYSFDIAEVTFLDRVRHIIMPSFVLGLVSLAGWTRYTRSSILEVMRQDYVRTARAKGLSERLVFSRHIFRNGMIPIITLVTMHIPRLLGGATITEIIFSWPGIGQLIYESVICNDFNVTMAAVMMISLLVVLSNLLADILYVVIDPRIRLHDEEL